MDSSDFFISILIGAVGAMVGLHFTDTSRTKTNGDDPLKGMSLEQLMAKKEEFEDIIAEYLAALNPKDQANKNG